MKCKNCGFEFAEGVFCPECGTRNDFNGEVDDVILENEEDEEDKEDKEGQDRRTRTTRKRRRRTKMTRWILPWSRFQAFSPGSWRFRPRGSGW